MKVKIHNETLFHQRILFDDVGKGKKTPTDIDFVFDFGGEVIVMIENKFKGNYLHKGQEILLRTLADGYTKGLLVPATATHSCTKPTVSTNEMRVDSYYYKGLWVECDLSVNQFIHLALQLPRN
jgi:hypothetical protein